jgi:hypothetical protein
MIDAGRKENWRTAASLARCSVMREDERAPVLDLAVLLPIWVVARTRQG